MFRLSHLQDKSEFASFDLFFKTGSCRSLGELWGAAAMVVLVCREPTLLFLLERHPHFDGHHMMISMACQCVI